MNENEQARCDDCGRTWPIGDLAEPKRLSERLDPGGVVPAGECPDCGALAYPVRPGRLDPCAQIAESIGYSATDDETGSIETLIDYKNALEDRVRDLAGDPSGEAGTPERAAAFGGRAVEVGSPDRGQNDDRTDAIDTVANVLHWLGSRGEDDPAACLSSAATHYFAESERREGDPA
jgi:hypothetical protein